MAYIGHYLNLLRIIGGRPSRAELARMHRARFNAAVWRPLVPAPIMDGHADVNDPVPRADPEPEPQ